MFNYGEANESHEYVVVRLEDEYFAFDVADTAEIFTYTEPVRMPRAPKFIVGVIDVRGHMLPVVDLRLRAGLDATAKPAHILAVRLGDGFIGAAVDKVCDVYTADKKSIGDVATLAGKLDSQFVRRALRWGQRLVPVMDAARLLTTDETLRLRRLRQSPRRRRGEKSEQSFSIEQKP
ncbi:MAG: chemotaxis protein CheW [Pyrinomonadaceae bacterium]|nr:chemotaxis protein CheW [Pyrinomonadaceae bacterium]